MDNFPRDRRRGESGQEQNCKASQHVDHSSGWDHAAVRPHLVARPHPVDPYATMEQLASGARGDLPFAGSVCGSRISGDPCAEVVSTRFQDRPGHAITASSCFPTAPSSGSTFIRVQVQLGDATTPGCAGGRIVLKLAPPSRQGPSAPHRRQVRPLEHPPISACSRNSARFTHTQ